MDRIVATIARYARLHLRPAAFHTTLMTRSANVNSPTSFVSLYATTFVVGVTMITLGPLLDPILKDLHIPLAQGGMISAGFAVGMLIGVVALNFLLARVPVNGPW